jgi:hypothetical protein
LRSGAVGLRDRLKRAEKATEERTVLLTCRDTGEELRVPEDAGLRLIAADWCEGAGQEHHDSLVDWLFPYLERGLLDEQGREWPIGDVGGGMHGLTG